MQVGVLKTDYGTHTPEQWADVTARQVVDIIRGAKGALLDETMKLQENVARIMAQHHRMVQDRERENLKNDHEHMLSPLDPTAYIDDAVDDIISLTHGSSVLSEHFKKSEVREFLQRVVARHFCSSMHVERLHHCDMTKDHPHRHTYKNAYGLQVVDHEDDSRNPS